MPSQRSLQAKPASWTAHGSRGAVPADRGRSRSRAGWDEIADAVMTEAAKSALHQHDHHENRESERKAKRGHAPERDRAQREAAENGAAGPQCCRAESEQPDLQAAVLQSRERGKRIARENDHVDADHGHGGRGPEPRTPPLAKHDPRQHYRAQWLNELVAEVGVGRP